MTGCLVVEIQVHYAQLGDVGDEGVGYWNVGRMFKVSREGASIRESHEDAVREAAGAIRRVAGSALDRENLRHKVCGERTAARWLSIRSSASPSLNLNQAMCLAVMASLLAEPSPAPQLGCE